MKRVTSQIRVWGCAALLACGSIGAVAVTSAWAETATDPKKATTEAKPDPKDDPKPETKPAKRTQPEELTKAVNELTKEFTDWSTKTDSPALRATPDYWKSLPASVTVDDVLGVLEKNLTGGPSQQAYVKWQLTHVLPSKLEGPQAARLASIYNRAPHPIPGIGTDPKVKAKLEAAIAGKKEELLADFQDPFDKEKSKLDSMNRPIMGYRNALYQRLPITAMSIILGFEDIVIRMNSGHDAKAFWNSVQSDIQTWSASDGNPNQLREMAAAVRKLKSVKGPNSYLGVEVKDGKLKWTQHSPKLDDKGIEALAKLLEETAKSASGGGLKFKDSKEKK